MDLVSILYHAYLCHKNFIFSDPPRLLETFFIVCDPPHLCTQHYCCALEFPSHFYFLLFATHLTLALLDLAPDHFVLISLFLCAPAHPRSTHSCVPRLTPSEYHYNTCVLNYNAQIAILLSLDIRAAFLVDIILGNSTKSHSYLHRHHQ